ncbi:hypothetical protein QTQ03_25740 [Micromonospora sp. WMMA1363]|uniref:hypothetical protein n=1 Tax=Micromonospora sp. WMMA1363 TaxID=3053985 RepID=UPI00259C766D|nr:hypothetical protein [Micromonospora sp. WMMA1363]MDM4722836.1 hypothetical protein [Micromonospora sp. WMMA1363]
MVVAAIALTALSACASTEQSDGDRSTAGDGAKVATLTSPGSNPSASAQAQRPRARLDTTPEEWEALLAPYNKCMREHGVDSDVDRKKAQDSGVRVATSEEQRKLTEANQICEPQYYPLPAWEKDPANPEARDFALAVVDCLKDKGVEHAAVGGDGVSLELGGDKNDARSIRLGLEKAPECERQVAAATR